MDGTKAELRVDSIPRITWGELKSNSKKCGRSTKHLYGWNGVVLQDKYQSFCRSKLSSLKPTQLVLLDGAVSEADADMREIDTIRVCGGVVGRWKQARVSTLRQSCTE